MAKGKDPSDTIQEFKSCVNMDAKELEKWLKTSESKKVSPFALPISRSRPPAIVERHAMHQICSRMLKFDELICNMTSCRLAGHQMVVSQPGMSQDALLLSSFIKRRTIMTRMTSST